MKKINENTKVTINFKQLKKLVKEGFKEDAEAWEIEDAWEEDLNEIDSAQWDLKAYATKASEAIDKEEYEKAFEAACSARDEANKLIKLLGRNGYGDDPASSYDDEEEED